MQPFISAIVPTHNRGDLTCRAVETILAQTEAPLEIIVVDDASCDTERGIVERAFSGNDLVRFLWLPRNGGACRARNAGVSVANGEWIAFLDSDDRWLPGKLAAQVPLTQDPEVVAVFTGRTNQKSGCPDVIYPMPARVGFGDLASENVLGTTSSALVRKRALEMVGGFDPTLPSCQDWDLWLRLSRVGSLVSVPESHLLYDDGEHLRISRSSEKVIKGHQIVFEKIYKMVDDPLERRRLRRRHEMWLAGTKSYHFGLHREAIADGTKALLADPCLYRFVAYALILRHIVWRYVANRLPVIGGMVARARR